MIGVAGIMELSYIMTFTITQHFRKVKTVLFSYHLGSESDFIYEKLTYTPTPRQNAKKLPKLGGKSVAHRSFEVGLLSFVASTVI